ncbi:MAG: hypothetical protein CMO55_18345 [Verrucomicrobiales bacterium]|nr:hypothetical protein [Verrucomicrobiales bacterium]
MSIRFGILVYPMPYIRSLCAFLLFSSSVFGEEFEVADGLTATSAVLPGLVQHPVMACLDDQGRLFVAEASGENLKKDELLAQTPALIRLLEDTDKDGVFDKQTVFAEGLTFPQGALWIYDSLYVMSPPGLWRFTDTDGDGKADEREELVTGFDFTGNAADVHGPFLHPNGRLFWCHGRKGFAVPDSDTGQILYEGKGARIWSSSLSGGDVEPFAGGGMDNPVEIDFTDEGEILGTVNLFYGRPRGDVLNFWAYGGAYPRHDQGQVVAEFTRTGDLLPPVHNFGHVAVSGMCRYRSGRLNRSWQDGWLVSHFNTSQITLTKTERKGAGFTAPDTQTIFQLLKPDAHLTDVLEDHNGDLLAIDTGGWFRIGCPTSQIAKPDVAGGIYRISQDGESYLPPSYPNWNRITSERVSQFLSSKKDWIAERAITELAVRGDPAIPELRRIINSQDSSPTARRNAIWTMARMKFSEATDLLYESLTDPDPGVRQAACNAISVTRTWQSIAANEPAERDIELERNRTISGALALIVRGDEPQVAREAAVALGRMGEARAIGAIAGRLGRAGDDRFLQHSLIYALIEIDDYQGTHNLLTSENPAVVSGVLWALEEMPSSKLQVLDVLPFLESRDDKLRETVYTLALRHHEWDAALANQFFRWRENWSDGQKSAMESIVPAFLDHPPMRDFLTSLFTSPDTERQEFGLSLLSESPSKVPFSKEWKPVFVASLAPDASPDTLSLALDAALRVETQDLTPHLESLLTSPDLSRIQRVQATRALATQDSAISAPAFDLLVEILRDETDPIPRREAISILSGSKLNSARRERIAEVIHTFGPLEMASLFDLFPVLHTPEQAKAVADAVVASPAFANLSVSRLRKLFEPYQELVGTQIENKIKEVEEQQAQREERIESLIAGMEEADAENGKKLFASGKGTCMVCHAIGDIGGKVGPNLTTIGRIRNSRDLFESILFPSESIARDFNTFEVTLEPSGEKQIGIIASRSDREIELIDPASQSHFLPADDIQSIKPLSMSLMPMGLDQTMTQDELRDLVSYLLSLK